MKQVVDKLPFAIAASSSANDSEWASVLPICRQQLGNPFKLIKLAAKQAPARHRLDGFGGVVVFRVRVIWQMARR